MASQNSDKIMFWRGTRFVFERKIQRGELVTGTVYFVGNSMEDVEGTGQSTYGVIYQAVSESKAVRYGIFATDDDITRLIEELTEKIDEEGEERREADDQLSERIAHLIPEVADAVENHMAIFDSDGRLKDSGRDIVEFLMDGDIDDATIKFENGKLVVQNYSHRHHVSDIDGLRTELDTKMGNELLGTSNGIATLDENAKLKKEQLPYTAGDGISIEGNEISNTHTHLTSEEIDEICVTSETETPERNDHYLDNWGLKKLWDKIKNFFVQKEEGKGLSSNDYTDSEKSKLAGIEQGAEVNVQSDWNQTNTSADDYIKNKPSVYTKTEIDQMLTGNVKREIVSELPQTGVDGTIYMVPSATAATGDVYDEYMWLSTQGQVAAHFEKIGTTKADLANYYTKSEVDTALGNKQASITITNNTSTPADNDTVIMQASGTTNTTTFLRRTMSMIWNYINLKAKQVYIPFGAFNMTREPNYFGWYEKLYDLQFDDCLYGAHVRFNIDAKIVDSNNTVLYELTDIQKQVLFTQQDNAFLSDLWSEGTKLVIEITPLSGNSNLNIGNYGWWFFCFSYNCYPTDSMLCRIRTKLYSATEEREYSEWIDAVAYSLRGGISVRNQVLYARTTDDSTLFSVQIEIGGGVNSKGNKLKLSEIIYISGRQSGLGKLTKHAFRQRFYGDIESTKFIKTGGTSSQLLAANGDSVELPLAINKGGTGGTTATAAEYNILSKANTYLSGVVTDDSWRIPFISASPSTSNGRIVGYKLPSQMWYYIKSKADLVYSTITETNKKTNRVIDHTWNQPSYSASAGGTHVKICDIPSDCVCVMNVRKSVYGYPSINTLWIGNNNSLDFKSLTETDIVATVSSRICTLSVPAHTASGTPLHTYDFEISVLNKDDLSAITWYDDATYYSPSRPTKPNVVMQQSAPVTDGSLAFNVNSSTHVASVSVDGYTDFVGMLTEDSESAVLVKLSDEVEGSVYRFTFDHAIEGGVSFSNSNASTVYCEVSQDIHAGDTITLTAVSNTADGWIASVSSAGIISSDNSVGIEWENGVADLSVEGIPFNNLVNNAMFQEGDSPYPLAVGSGAVSLLKSGDQDYPFILTGSARGIFSFKVNGSTESVHIVSVTGGTTYSLTVSGTTISYTPSGNGYAIVFQMGPLSQGQALVAGTYWYINGNRIEAQEVTKSGNYYVARLRSSTSIDSDSALNVQFIYKQNLIYVNSYPQAFGKECIASGEGSSCVGVQSKAIGGRTCAFGNGAKALGYCSIALGNADARGDYSTVVGNSGLATKSSSTSIGYMASAKGTYSTSVGSLAKTEGSYSLALGCNAQATSNYSAALSPGAKAIGERSLALGDSSKSAYLSGDSTYPRYLVKRFTAINFIEGGETKKLMFVNYGSSVTISLSGNSITLTPPNQDCKFFIIVNDSVANRAYRGVINYARINGIDQYASNISGFDIKTEVVNGNSYYAMWFYGLENNFPSTIDSFSYLAYYKHTDSSSFQIAMGYMATAIYGNSIAIGVDAKAIKSGQIVIGSGVIPNENDMLIIGNGSGSANMKGNILTIDDNEVMHVRGIVNEVRTIDTGGTSASVTQIKQGVIKVTGGGSLGLSTTGAVDGLSVKIYASGASVMMPDFSLTITDGRWHEFIFLDGAWHSQM